MTMEFYQFGKVRAVLEPKRLDDLKAGARRFIGREGIFDVLWIISEEDGGNYVGQHAMGRPREWAEECPDDENWEDGFYWVPEEDLRILEVVKPGLWPVKR
jgi:hypothetical protein